MIGAATSALFVQAYAGHGNTAELMGELLTRLRAKLPAGEVELHVDLLPSGFHLTLTHRGRIQ